MKRVGIIGAGNLGGSVARLFKKNLGVNDSIAVSNKPINDFHQCTNIENILRSNILILCVKPEQTMNALEEIKNTKMTYKLNTSPLLISFITGVSLNFYEKHLGNIPIIRCTADISISKEEGAIIYVCNDKVDESLRNTFNELVKGVNKPDVENKNKINIKEVEDEKLIDISTVLNGCGPAYLSYLFREFIHFGNQNGFSEEEASQLFLSTVQGTTNLLKSRSPQEIIDIVSSPGGITEKGISFLEESGTVNIENLLNYTLNNIKKFD